MLTVHKLRTPCLYKLIGVIEHRLHGTVRWLVWSSVCVCHVCVCVLLHVRAAISPVQLHYAFQDANYLYMVMEYMPGRWVEWAGQGAWSKTIMQYSHQVYTMYQAHAFEWRGWGRGRDYI